MAKGYKVRVHPPAGKGKSTRPDFLAEHPLWGDVYVEATGGGELPWSGRDRENAHLLDALNEPSTPQMLLSVHIEGRLRRGLPKKKIRAAAQAWLDTVALAELRDLHAKGDFSAMPTYSYGFEGGTVRITPLPAHRNCVAPSHRH